MLMLWANLSIFLLWTQNLMASQVLSDIKIYGNGTRRLFDKLGEAIGANEDYKIPSAHEPTDEETDILNASFLDKGHHDSLDDAEDEDDDEDNQEAEDEAHEEDDEDDEEADYSIEDPYVSLLELNATKNSHLSGINKHVLAHDQTDAENELLRQAGNDNIDIAKFHSPVLSPKIQSHIQLSNEEMDDDKTLEPDQDDNAAEVGDLNAESNDDVNTDMSGNPNDEDTVDLNADAHPDMHSDAETSPDDISDLDPSKYPSDIDADDLIPKNPEDMLSVDLQGSQPEIVETEPHSIEGRHSWNDIKMTESLRTGELEPHKASGADSLSLGVTSLTIVFASIYHFYL